MENTIYLMADEQGAYSALSADLKEGWTMLTEEFSKFETAKQLQMRHFLADFTANPELGTFYETLQEDPAQFTEENLKALSPDMQEEVYFLLGARGVDVFVKELLKNLVTDEDLRGLAMLTTIRHKLLEINAKSTHV